MSKPNSDSSGSQYAENSSVELWQTAYIWGILKMVQYKTLIFLAAVITPENLGWSASLYRNTLIKIQIKEQTVQTLISANGALLSGS